MSTNRTSGHKHSRAENACEELAPSSPKRVKVASAEPSTASSERKEDKMDCAGDGKAGKLLLEAFMHMSNTSKRSFLKKLIEENRLDEIQNLHQAGLASQGESMPSARLIDLFFSEVASPLATAMRLKNWPILDELMKWVLDLAKAANKAIKKASKKQEDKEVPIELNLLTVQQYVYSSLITSKYLSIDKIEAFKAHYKLQIHPTPRIFLDQKKPGFCLIEALKNIFYWDTSVWEWLFSQKELPIPENFGEHLISELQILSFPRTKETAILSEVCEIFYDHPALKAQFERNKDQLITIAIARQAPSDLVSFFYRHGARPQSPLKFVDAAKYALPFEYQRSYAQEQKEDLETQENPLKYLVYLDTPLSIEILEIISFILDKQPELVDNTFIEKFVLAAAHLPYPGGEFASRVKQIVTQIAGLMHGADYAENRAYLSSFVLLNCYNFQKEEKSQESLAQKFNSRVFSWLIEPLQNFPEWNTALLDNIFDIFSDIEELELNKTYIFNTILSSGVQKVCGEGADGTTGRLMTDRLFKSLVLHLPWVSQQFDFCMELLKLFQHGILKANLEKATLNEALFILCSRSIPGSILILILQALEEMGAELGAIHPDGVDNLLLWILAHSAANADTEVLAESFELTEYLITKVDPSMKGSYGLNVFETVAEAMWQSRKKHVPHPPFFKHEQFLMKTYPTEMALAQKTIHEKHHRILLPHENVQSTHDQVNHSASSQSALNLVSLYLPKEEKERSVQIDETLNEFFSRFTERLRDDFQRVYKDKLSKVPVAQVVDQSVGLLFNAFQHLIKVDDKVLPTMAASHAPLMYREKFSLNEDLWDCDSFVQLCWWKENLLRYGDQRDKSSGVSVKELFTALWRAIHDSKYFKKTETIDEVTEAEAQLFRLLVKLHREAPHPEKPNVWLHSCFDGIFNAFGLQLRCIHPAVVILPDVSTQVIGSHFMDFYLEKLANAPDKVALAWTALKTGALDPAFIERHKSEYMKLIGPSVNKKILSMDNVDACFECGIELSNYPMRSCVYELIAKTPLFEQGGKETKDEAGTTWAKRITDFYCHKIAELSGDRLNALAAAASEQMGENAIGEKFKQPKLPKDFVEHHQKECFEQINRFGKTLSEDGFKLCLEFGFMLSNNLQIRDSLKPRPVEKTLPAPIKLPAQSNPGSPRFFASPRTTVASPIDPMTIPYHDMDM